jgi:hypothetical protein
MSISIHPKFIPYAKLSKHKQRDAYIKLRSTIKRTQSQYGKNFTSRYVFEDGRPAICNQDFDFYFLGLDGHTIWNAYLATASHGYWDKISELSRAKADEIKPPREFNIRETFIPVYDASGRLKHYTMELEKPAPEFGNRTRYEWMRDYESELIKADIGTAAPVHEYFHFDYSYKYGIGLHAVLDVPEVNAAAIEGMIEKFRAMGEKPWKSATPVPYANLPKDTFHNLATEQKLNEWSPNNS